MPAGWDRRMKCLGARLLIGAEDRDTLCSLTVCNYIIDREPDYRRTVYQRPLLTVGERDAMFCVVG
jgi:hypothetical protein